MNKTYRSVCNEARGAWVAASELGGDRRKGAQRAAVGVALMLLAMGAAQGQVKIGNNPTTINPGSALEIETPTRGVLMPRVALTDRATWTLNGNQPAEGMMVYNTNATTGANGLQAGMAVWKGGQWVSVDETPYLHVNSTAVGNSTLANSGATGANSIAVGPNATASAENALAVGMNAQATAVGSVALGAGSVASTGSGVAGYIPPAATAEQRTAIGTTTSTLAAVSVGDAANGQYRQITGVAAGTVDSDAVNVSQLKAVQGQVTQIDQGTVKYDTNVDGTTNYNSVTMGGSNTTGPVTVHNVAEGVAGTDAVNVNQLNGATTKLNNRIDNLADQVSANTRMLSGGIAASAAMAVVTPVEPGRYHVSGAVAGYNGQAGIGFNLLKRSDNGQTTLHAGVGWGSGGSKAIVRVGFGFSFD
jgi:autotransporter adhesin